MNCFFLSSPVDILIHQAAFVAVPHKPSCAEHGHIELEIPFGILSEHHELTVADIGHEGYIMLLGHFVI